ncbi:hypothetical protein J437_LFUL017144 [Ladona fulva]|uniref:Uncharacterized protein n=1 Tax=Ladona fulva TaxID=123851 RepID=A0A8K0P5T9_LADFU|nr:hypothetical protein J437_LFUL017144 [Ladona fulva]
MEAYEKIDKGIAKAALQKISQHLWYLTDEVSILSLFHDYVDQETKVKMVENLTKENLSTHGKRYIQSKEELCGPLYGSIAWKKEGSRAVNDTAERAVKLIQDFQDLITV